MSELMPAGAESLFHGDPSHGHEDATANCDVWLWQAVVARCWEDAFSPSWILGARPEEWEVVRAEARRWLLINHSAWREDRDEVCCRADLDGDEVRQAAVKRMELARIEDNARRETALAGIDRAFENLLAREASGMLRGNITRALRHLADREANV